MPATTDIAPKWGTLGGARLTNKELASAGIGPLLFTNNGLSPNSRCEKIEIESRGLFVSSFNFNRRVKYP